MQSTTLKSRRGQVPQHWRGVVPVHAAADLLPSMTESDLRALGEDIERHGLHTPVVIFTDQEGTEYLLDGRSRLDAMELVGITIVENGELNPDIVHNISGNIDPFAWVLSANLHRRHLTSEQKREVIAGYLKAKPEQSNRTIAKQVKSDHKTVGTVRDKLEATGEIPQLEKTTGADGKERKQRTKKKPKAVEPSVSADHETPVTAESTKVEEEKPTEQPPEVKAIADPPTSGAVKNQEQKESKDAPLATLLRLRLNAVWELLQTEANWPPLNPSRQKRRDMAIKGWCRAGAELVELAKPAPKRGRPPKASVS